MKCSHFLLDFVRTIPINIFLRICLLKWARTVKPNYYIYLYLLLLININNNISFKDILSNHKLRCTGLIYFY